MKNEELRIKLQLKSQESGLYIKQRFKYKMSTYDLDFTTTEIYEFSHAEFL